MAHLKANDISIAAVAGRIGIRLPIDGRGRTVVLDPAHALDVSNRLGNAAADALPSQAALPNVAGIHLLPFGNEAGPAHAAVRFVTDAGPVILRFDAQNLGALAAAAAGALELAKSSGSA